MRDLLSDLRRSSNGHLVVQELDPDDDEAAQEEASSLGVYPIEFNVLRDDEFQVKRGYYGLAVLYADAKKVIPVIQRTDDLEYRLASAIYSMTTEERPGVAFLQGFGAKGDYDLPDLRTALADRFNVRTIRMSPDSTPPIAPDSTRAVVVAGPTQALDSLALKRLGDYVGGGGALPSSSWTPSTSIPRVPSRSPFIRGWSPSWKGGGCSSTRAWWRICPPASRCRWASRGSSTSSHPILSGPS